MMETPTPHDNSNFACRARTYVRRLLRPVHGIVRPSLYCIPMHVTASVSICCQIRTPRCVSRLLVWGTIMVTCREAAQAGEHAHACMSSDYSANTATTIYIGVYVREAKSLAIYNGIDYILTWSRTPAFLIDRACVKHVGAYIRSYVQITAKDQPKQTKSVKHGSFAKHAWMYSGWHY